MSEALHQTKPFRSRRQEAILALLLTTDAVRRRFADILGARGDLTLQQYNVLRILRGAGVAGLPTLAIPDRLVERAPGITRLIDRLASKGLVERDRSPEDRRQVVCKITKAGLRELEELDEAMDGLDDMCLDCLTPGEVATWIRLLNKVRIHQP
ncbi:MAG: MarR family winged helix-turn-helix transcriptional regulator [Planctomycetota bacterium]